MNYKTAVNITGFLVLFFLITIFYQAHLYLSLQQINGIIDHASYLDRMNIAVGVLIVTLLADLFILRAVEQALQKDEELNKKNLKNLQMLNDFYTILQETKGIKNISNVSLEFISKQLAASSASMYISNYKNMKMQLLGVYNRNINSSTKIIDMYAGVIGEAFSTGKIKMLDTKTVKIFAIPLIDNRKIIGVIELKFYSEISSLNLNQRQKTILKIITNTLIKELEDEQNQKYFKLIDKNVLLSSTNTNGEITFVSEAFCNATGYERKTLIGNTHQLLKHPDVTDNTFKGLWETIKCGKVWHKEIPNMKKDGSTYWAKTTVSPEFDFYGNIIGYDAIREDITDKKLIEKISITDSLTSLYNRRYFDKMFNKQINLAKRLNKTLIFGILDIDHFKQYNDTYGHQEGDETLKRVAVTIKKSLKRESDLVFRLGGEEFGILYFVEDEKDGDLIADNLRENIENLKIEHINNSASSYVTISCGLYIYKGENENTELIYKKADDLLYKAKQNGRNKVYTNIKKG
ncbi:MAG: sensor domain-containing diguanylate cyclase [Campylobacterota bacterium]|nr:sensor domain-containing diguanylate cyclase [Campylobacterota bacterium]